MANLDKLVAAHSQPKSFWGWFTIFFLVPLFGAALVVLLFLAYYLTGDRHGRDATVVFRSESLRLLIGQGEQTANGLTIRQLAEDGYAFISAPIAGLPVQRSPELEWHISGLDKQTDIRVIWETESAPGTAWEVPIQYNGTDSGRLRLAGEKKWRGMIVSLGLMVRAPLPADFAVHQLVLRPAKPRARLLLARMWREWIAFEGWSGWSAHFIVGGKRGSLFPPVLAAFTWVAVNTLLYSGLILSRRQEWHIKPVIVFFLMGWLALDARWQIDLWRQLGDTHERYAGKTWQEKRLAADDNRIFGFIKEIKKSLPAEPTRIFLISAAPVARRGTEYRRLRAHYHLLPHNVYSESARPPSKSDTKLGDYILILTPIQGLKFLPREKLLRWGNNERLEVELVSRLPMGVLFKVL